MPSAGVGALLALILCGLDLSIMGMIGIILLIGIVKKNAIMMIDFALTAEREHGLPRGEAIRQGCLLRFRPIMMTTMAALLGALPLALGTGAGAELRRPLGIAIVGGLLVSQVLTLFTTPVVYLWFDRLAHVMPIAGRRRPERPVAEFVALSQAPTDSHVTQVETGMNPDETHGSPSRSRTSALSAPNESSLWSMSKCGSPLLEAAHTSDPSFDPAMVLFKSIIQVDARSVADVAAKR